MKAPLIGNPINDRRNNMFEKFTLKLNSFNRVVELFFDIQMTFILRREFYLQRTALLLTTHH